MGDLRVWTGTPVVIDSSVAFKWFDTSEPGADIAGSLLTAHADEKLALVTAAHLPLEVLNALACRRAALDQLEAAIGFLAGVDLLIAPVDQALLADAVRIADAERHTLYDAAFIALAARIDAELVTADRRQAQTTSCRVRLVS